MPNAMCPRQILVSATLICALTIGGNADARQASTSGATEEFSPQFDVGYAMQPSVGWFGLTELMIAALVDDAGEVARLLAAGADIHATDDTGGTPLMWAVQGGSMDVVDLLIDAGSDVQKAGGRNATAFMIAVISGKEEIGVRLLEAGATFGGELSYQQDYLQYAAANGQATMVRALIEHGADVEASGADALCLASRYGHIDAARALIEEGTDVNRRGNQSNDLPLIHALQANDESLIRLLVDSGADPNLRNKAGDTSMLYYATQTGQPSIVAYLLDNGASLAPQEADQLLRSAIYKGSQEMVDLFVSRGATISTRNLFNAVANRQFGIADTFADVIGLESLDDYMMDLLIDHAASGGHQPMVNELLDIVATREARGRLRLLFETVEDAHCRLQTWDPWDRAVTATIVEELSCESSLFTARRDGSVFVVEDQRIDIHSANSAFDSFSLAVPTGPIDARLEELREQFAREFSGNHDWVSAEIVTVGYLDNGQITLITHTSGPADGTYASQFAWDGGTWTLIGTQNCHRFDWICHVPGVDGQSIDRWPMRRAVWHTALQRNPGFVERIALSAATANELPRFAVIFEFNGRQSELGYTLDGSDHCAEECTFTTAVSLDTGAGDPVEILLAMSRVSIADRFLLVRPSRELSRIHDLVTGEDLLGDIGRATWIH